MGIIGHKVQCDACARSVDWKGGELLELMNDMKEMRKKKKRSLKGKFFIYLYTNIQTL